MPDFFVQTEALRSPTECVFCRSSTDPDGFIDGGQEIVGYGWLHICATCARQAGARFGMVPAADAEKLRAKVATLRAELRSAKAELATERDRILVSGKELHRVLLEGA